MSEKLPPRIEEQIEKVKKELFWMKNRNETYSGKCSKYAIKAICEVESLIEQVQSYFREEGEAK